MITKAPQCVRAYLPKGCIVSILFLILCVGALDPQSSLEKTEEVSPWYHHQSNSRSQIKGKQNSLLFSLPNWRCSFHRLCEHLGIWESWLTTILRTDHCQGSGFFSVWHAFTFSSFIWRDGYEKQCGTVLVCLLHKVLPMKERVEARWAFRLHDYRSDGGFWVQGDDCLLCFFFFAVQFHPWFIDDFWYCCLGLGLCATPSLKCRPAVHSIRSRAFRLWDSLCGLSML